MKSTKTRKATIDDFKAVEEDNSAICDCCKQVLLEEINIGVTCYSLAFKRKNMELYH